MGCGRPLTLLTGLVWAAGYLVRAAQGSEPIAQAAAIGQGATTSRLLAFAEPPKQAKSGKAKDKDRDKDKAGAASDVSRWCLVTAIAALGMKTSFKALVAVGWRPVALMILETVWIGGLVMAAVLLSH